MCVCVCVCVRACVRACVRTVLGAAQMLGSMLYGFVFSYVLSFGMSFLLSTFITLPVKERVTGAKHCQIISGVQPSTYWLTMLVWNLVNYVVPSLCVVGIVLAFDIEAFAHGLNAWYVCITRSLTIILNTRVYSTACFPIIIFILLLAHVFRNI